MNNKKYIDDLKYEITLLRGKLKVANDTIKALEQGNKNLLDIQATVNRWNEETRRMERSRG
jgi:hypothetical protein